MNNNGNQAMQMESYMFMGMHVFWWLSILIFALIVLAVAHRYRKRK